jgi:hypothetical protein
LTGLVLLRKLSGQTEKREINQPLVVKPDPEYASKDHSHHQYITKEDCRAAHIQAGQAETGKFEAIQRQLDHMNNSFVATLARHNDQAEERAAKLHSRIDPIAQLSQATNARFDDHIEDHRNGRFDNAG